MPPEPGFVPKESARPREGTIVIGNVNIDVLVTADELPAPGTERLTPRADIRIGGAAGNVALALAHLDVAERTYLVGSVGDDAPGRMILSELTAVGLSVRDLMTIDGVATSVSLAVESDVRNRAFLTSVGALAHTQATLSDDLLELASSMLLCGYFLCPNLRKDSQSLLELARQRNKRVLFDPGDSVDGWPESVRDEIVSLLPMVDVFLPNEDEVAALTGSDDVLAGAAQLSTKLPDGGVVLAKRGAQGAVVATRTSVIEIPAPSVVVVDTTGAGDAFNAAVILGLETPDADWESICTGAVRFASRVVASPSGVRYSR